MSFSACFICGIYIMPGPFEGSWLQKFRILYSVHWDANFTVISDPWSTVPSDAGVAHISGVGIDIAGPWQVPMGENMSWDDGSYVPQENDRVALMEETPVEGRHGFVLHDSCWRLLRAALHPQPVPLVRLFRLCKSLPMSDGDERLCWDHYYGGLLAPVKCPECNLPGGQQPRDLLCITDLNWENASDPYDVPEVSQLSALPRYETESRVLKSSRESRDCFAGIPLEIREAIAVVTPTKDALNLGLASRSFTDIVTRRTFWASRFAPGAECDFIFETRITKQATDLNKLYRATDWRQLYQSTGEHRASPPLQQRMRIWKLILYIKELLELRPESGESRVARTHQLQDGEDIDLRWRRVTGDVQERGEDYQPYFLDGCRAFDEARAVVSPSLSRIAFSVTQGEGADYVAGLRFISAEDGDQQIGFRAKAKERSFAVTANALRGFKVAVGMRGIRALQVVCQDGTQSPWFGRPQNTPITERLVCATRIVALDALFDGYKLVGLAVAEARANPDLLKPSSNLLDSPEPPLRATAVWSPAVPPQGLYLNDASFVRIPQSMSGYRPMSWILFGDREGERLSNLTGVSVRRSGKQFNIRFHYDSRRLQSQELSFRSSRLSAGNTEHFPIDGKGGELITALVGGICSCEFSLKITTNRDRSFYFSALPSPLGPSLKSLSIARNTTIVGLFICHHPVEGVIGFGVISAKIHV